MNILFLDDNEARTNLFRRWIPGGSHTTTAAGMIALLSNTEVTDLAFLDHDLGGEVFVDSGREDCGMEVVRWVVQNKPSVRQFVVHTLNPSAGEEMARRLSEAGYTVDQVPFINIAWGHLSSQLEDHENRSA